jgi:hypothetical protein
MFVLFKKFLNIDAPESGGATTEAPSIAGLMAKSGVLNSSDTPVATPISTTEKKETPAPAPEATPATGTAQTAETGKSESPSSTEGKKGETQKEEPKIPSWQEVLKSQQPDTILKELGFDEKTVNFLKGKKGIEEKMLNFFSHWEANNGDVSRYMQELNTDYSKMPSTEVMRHQLRREYPKATEKQIDALYKKQVLDNYKLDPNMYSEDEVAEGQLLIDAVAEKHREQFVNEQQQYLIPKPVTKDEGPDLELEAAKTLYNSSSQTISEMPPIKELLINKSLTFGDGDEKYNIPIPFAGDIVEDIQKTLAINIAEGRITKDTISQITPEVVQNEIWSRAFSKNPQAFMTALAEHFKTIGGKKIIEPLENASPSVNGQPSKSEVSPSSPASAMAKGGRLVSGD